MFYVTKCCSCEIPVTLQLVRYEMSSVAFPGRGKWPRQEEEKDAFSKYFIIFHQIKKIRKIRSLKRTYCQNNDFKLV